MGNLLVLGDSDIHEILINLSKDEILAFRDVLARCLTDYSVGAERKYQPLPGVINRPEGQKCLFRPFTSADAIGTKIVIQPAPTSRTTGALHGMIAMCDSDGLPSGLLNAEEVTGYRTALTALIPYLWRRHTEEIVVFGAGKQALWHLRLALALRGHEIKSIVLVNRTASRAEELLAKVKKENEARWKSATSMQHIDPSRPDFQDCLKMHLSTADAIFCTVGTTEPLFPASYVGLERRERQPYISAVGAWQPDMIELDPELLHQTVNQVSPGSRACSLLVDDREGVLHHSGEIARSKIEAEYLVETGEIESLKQDEGDNGPIQSWIQDGLLIYKSVGVGMTDLASSNAILVIARERQLGTTISQF
ncbi:putative proline utilization protein [Rosellinia necatrix]|uniref:Putative proline utilization protein n=1 Tax=Rosellinia necatrix TaxID=77044 RepID=A0A1W2TAF1_ROSNE|nr:putative proline utilization protein [Rosellinia necatrix]